MTWAPCFCGLPVFVGSLSTIWVVALSRLQRPRVPRCRQEGFSPECAFGHFPKQPQHHKYILLHDFRFTCPQSCLLSQYRRLVLRLTCTSELKVQNILFTVQPKLGGSCSTSLKRWKKPSWNRVWLFSEACLNHHPKVAYDLPSARQLPVVSCYFCLVANLCIV